MVVGWLGWRVFLGVWIVGGGERDERNVGVGEGGNIYIYFIPLFDPSSLEQGPGSPQVPWSDVPSYRIPPLTRVNIRSEQITSEPNGAGRLTHLPPARDSPTNGPRTRVSKEPFPKAPKDGLVLRTSRRCSKRGKWFLDGPVAKARGGEINEWRTVVYPSNRPPLAWRFYAVAKSHCGGKLQGGRGWYRLPGAMLGFDITRRDWRSGTAWLLGADHFSVSGFCPPCV